MLIRAVARSLKEVICGGGNRHRCYHLSAPRTTFEKAENQQVARYSEEIHKQWKGSFEFIFITDPQLGFINQYYEGGLGTKWEEELENIDKTIIEINKIRPRPKFVCIGGDMINAYPDKGEALRTMQADDLKHAFTKLNRNIPILCVSGNHDIGNHPDINSMRWYHRTFGDDYYSFWCGGSLFIVLNTQYLKNPPQVLYEEVHHQLRWLETLLQSVALYHTPPKHVILFMHIPMFYDHPDESTHPYGLPVEVRRLLHEQLVKANTKVILCGHLHFNSYRRWTCDHLNKEIEVVVSSALGCPLGRDPAGFRRVYVDHDVVRHEYVKVGTKAAADYIRLNR